MAYNAERSAFKRLKEHCPPEALAEYQLAVATVLKDYNTTLYENRFIVGGAVEVFTCALLRASGLNAALYADEEKAGDLLLPQGKRLSVKGSFTGGAAEVKLINQLGEGARRWDTATLFIVSEVGIVYGDPDLVAPEHIKQVADGLALRRQGHAALIQNKRYVIPLDLPRKPSAQTTAFSRKASATIAKQVMHEKRLSSLLSAFPEGQ